MTEAWTDNSHRAGRLAVLRDVEGRTRFSHPFAAQPAGENRSVAIPNHVCTDKGRKYQIWYDELIASARKRRIRSDYFEVHHILPRSMGGSDEPDNLVKLTYREHFIAHWLLTKFTLGRDRRKMQRALLAMTIQANGMRIVASWQFEVAKRAVKDLSLSARRIAAFRRAEKRSKALAGTGLPINKTRSELEKISAAFLAEHIRPEPTPKEQRKAGRRRRPRPSKRARQEMKLNNAPERSITAC